MIEFLLAGWGLQRPRASREEDGMSEFAEYENQMLVMKEDQTFEAPVLFETPDGFRFEYVAVKGQVIAFDEPIVINAGDTLKIKLLKITLE